MKLAVTPVEKLDVAHSIPKGSRDIALGLPFLCFQEQPSDTIGIFVNLPVPLVQLLDTGYTSIF